MNSPITPEQTTTLNLILENDLLEDKKLDKKNFRNKHYKYINELDFIEQREIVRTNYDTNEYELTSIALFLCDSDLSKQLFYEIDQVCDYLRSSYEKSTDTPVHLSDLIKDIALPENRIHQCLFYVHGNSLAQRSIDQATNENSINPDEKLLRFIKFSEIPESYLSSPSWFPEWSPDEKKINKPHGNTENNANKREQILGAALAVLAAYPQDCKTKSGNVKGSKIARLIEEKSLFLFEDSNGEPPYEFQTISDLVNKWLNITNKIK